MHRGADGKPDSATRLDRIPPRAICIDVRKFWRTGRKIPCIVIE
jgi:hypothetical protein